MTEADHGAEGGERLLVVDDDPFIARLLEIELTAAGFVVRVANDGQQALDMVVEETPDLVITDVMMPHVDGFELTRRLRDDPKTVGISVIILTARGLSADKLEGFAIGADDYIVKPFDTPELLARVRGVLRRSKELKEESQLTGLPGGVQAQEAIETRVAAGEEFALLVIDIDRMKSYNDRYGFARGDDVLTRVAQILGSIVDDVAPEDGFVGHLSSDDFAVILPPTEAAIVADRIVERFDAEIPHLYDPEDRVQGWVEVLNRRGEPERFPMLSISIGISTTQRRTFTHFAEAMAVANELLRFTKGTEGSSWAIDRRGSDRA